MNSEEYTSGMNRLAQTWPHAFPKTRAQTIWLRWQHLPKGVFLKTVNDMIGRGGNAQPAGMFDDELKKANQEFQAKELSKRPLRGCEECDYYGYKPYLSPVGTIAHAFCDNCELGDSLKVKLPSEEKLVKEGYTERKPLSKLTSLFTKAPINAELYGRALAALYRIVQRSERQGDERGLLSACKHFGISEREARSICKLMELGIVNDQVRKLKARTQQANTEIAIEAFEGP